MPYQIYSPDYWSADPLNSEMQFRRIGAQLVEFCDYVVNLIPLSIYEAEQMCNIFHFAY